MQACVNDMTRSDSEQTGPWQDLLILHACDESCCTLIGRQLVVVPGHNVSIAVSVFNVPCGVSPAGQETCQSLVNWCAFLPCPGSINLLEQQA